MNLPEAGVFLEGEKVILRPLREEDAEGRYPDWLNDAETSAGNSHHVYPYTRAQAREYLRSLNGRRDIVALAVVEKKSGLHAGNISLQSINYINRCAELAILLGEKDLRGKGLGLEASRLLAGHGFMALGLKRIELGTPEQNKGMQKIAHALGMTHEGTKRAAFFKNGHYQNILLFGLLAEEWITNK